VSDASTSGDRLYAYGVIEQEDLSLSVDAVAGASEVYTVDYRTLSAVVSDIDTTDPERTDENVQAHDDVLQTVLTHGGSRTVVPMSFGMAFNSARPLKGVMRGARRAFRKALNDVDGKIELGLKVVSTGDADLDREAVESTIADRLGEIATGETDNDLFSDRLLLNKSYLVDRGRHAEFDDAIDEFERRWADDATLKYTGPWAPYNFVDIQVAAEGQR
jgi:hypothetical protein